MCACQSVQLFFFHQYYIRKCASQTTCVEQLLLYTVAVTEQTFYIFLLVMFLQWAAELLNVAVLENASNLAEVLASSKSCLSGVCATDAAQAFVSITTSVVSLKVSDDAGSLRYDIGPSCLVVIVCKQCYSL